MQTLKHVGDALRAHRQARNLTLQQAAALADVDHTGLSRIERGTQSASTNMLLRLANAYGISLGELFGGVTGEQPAAAVSIPEIGITDAGEVVLDDGRRHGFVLADYSLAGHSAASFVVPDDAMVPVLHPGDVAAIDLNDTKIHTMGGVFAIVVDGQPAIRRLFPAPGGVIVQTANTNYPNLHLTGSASAELRILGRVKVARRRSGF